MNEGWPSYNVDSNENQPILLASVKQINAKDLINFKASYKLNNRSQQRNVPDTSDKGLDTYDLYHALESRLCETNEDCEENAEAILDMIKDDNGSRAATDLMDFCLRVLFYYRNFKKFKPGLETEIRNTLNNKINATQKEVKNNPRFNEKAWEQVLDVKNKVGVIVNDFFAKSKKFAKNSRRNAINTAAATAFVATSAFGWEPVHDVSLWVEWESLAITGKLGTDVWNLYLRWMSDFEEEHGVSTAYGLSNERAWVVLWGWFSKGKEWEQVALKLALHLNVFDNVYVKGEVWCKKFTPELEAYASSKECQQLLGAWINIFENLNIEGSYGESKLKVDWYDPETRKIWKAGAIYDLPNDVYIAPTFEHVSGDDFNKSSNAVMLNIGFKFGSWSKGASLPSDFAERQSANNVLGYGASYDSSMAQEKKDTQEALPEATYTASGVTVISGDGTNNIEVSTLSGTNLTYTLTPPPWYTVSVPSLLFVVDYDAPPNNTETQQYTITRTSDWKSQVKNVTATWN